MVWNSKWLLDCSLFFGAKMLIRYLLAVIKRLVVITFKKYEFSEKTFIYKAFEKMLFLHNGQKLEHIW